MAEMGPEGVPDEWLVAAHNAYYDDVHPSEHIATWRAMRAMLAAVLPLHEQQVRERIAAEAEIEWGVRWHDGNASHDDAKPSEAKARQFVDVWKRRMPQYRAELIQRTAAGKWRVVEDGSEEAGDRD